MPTAAYQRAFAVYQMRRLDDAIVEINRGLGDNPEDAYCHGLLAVIYSQRHKKKPATDSIHRALALEPDSAYIHYLASICFGNIGQLKLAEQSIVTALSIDANRATFHERYASVHVAKRRWREALTELDIALNIDPNHESALSLRTKVLTALGRKEEAELNGRMLLKMAPDAARPHIDAGAVFLSKGDKDAAYASYREALRINPNSDRAREGVLDALRSRFVLFRWFYAYRLWLESLTPGTRSAFLIGFYIVPRFVVESNSNLPAAVRVVSLTCAIVYFSLVTLSILVKPVTNVFLCFHPLGRLLLSAHQKAEAMFLFACLLLALLGLSFGIVLHYQTGYVLAGSCVLFGGMSSLLSLTRETGALRWVLFGIIASVGAAMALILILVSAT